MLALAGIPATAGFIGKFYLIEAAVDGDYTWLGVVIVIGSMISLAYYLRVVAAMWRDEAQPSRSRPAPIPLTGRAALAGGAPEDEPPRRGPAAGRRSSSPSSWALAILVVRDHPAAAVQPRRRRRRRHHPGAAAVGRRRRPVARSACSSARSGRLCAVRITAKADYAVRAAAELAAAEGEGPIKGERIATAQDIPLKFLENILSELRTAGIVASRRGAEGGYWLDRPGRRDHRRRRAARRRGAAGVDPRRPARSGSPTRARRPRCRACGSRCARTCARCSRA